MLNRLCKAVMSFFCCCAKANPVANLMELTARDDQELANGVLVYVETLRSQFILDMTSTTPVDGITVVATLSGVGRWLRLSIAHPSWLSQAEWFIDPVFGDDQNVGSTGATALKTHGELTRRWSTDFSTVVGTDSGIIAPIKLITVTLLGNLSATDPIHIRVSLGPNTLLAYVGSPTTVRSGSFTSVTSKDRASNTPWQIADAVSPFSAADVGRRVRITGGLNVGQFAWIAKDLGIGVMRMSNFCMPTMPGAPDVLIETGLTAGVASPGDPYAVENLTQVTVQSITVDSPVGGTATNATIGFVNIDFRNNGGALGQQSTVQGVVTAVFKGCSWNGQLVLGRHIIRHHYLNCRFGGLALNLVGPIFRGGLCQSTVASRGGITTFDNDFMVQGGNGLLVQVNGTLFGTACVFDSGADGFRIGAGDAMPSTASCFSLPGSGEHQLWGADNKGAGIGVSSGSVLSYQATCPTVTGSLGDFILAGAATSRAWDEGLGAYTPLLVNSWANLAAGIPPGFGGNAHNVARDAHIVLR